MGPWPYTVSSRSLLANEARTRTQRFASRPRRFSARPDTSSTAAAPSPRGQHCCTVRSPATFGEASTCSSVRGLRNCAYGFSAALPWFFTATLAIASMPAPRSRR
jgi:hypothetical protein